MIMKSKKKQESTQPGPSRAKTWKTNKHVKAKIKIRSNPIMGSVWEVIRGEVDAGFFF